MIFGKSGLQGFPTRVALFLWAFSRQGATGVPLFTTWDPVARGEPQYLETFRACADPGNRVSAWAAWATSDSGSRITGGGSEYAAILAHAGGVLYGMELGSVTLKRIGFFCFPIKHSTHTRRVGARGGLVWVLAHYSRGNSKRPLFKLYHEHLGIGQLPFLPRIQLSSRPGHRLRRGPCAGAAILRLLQLLPLTPN